MCQWDGGGLASKNLKWRIVREKGIGGVLSGSVVRIFAPGSSLKCAASSFLRKDHPHPGYRFHGEELLLYKICA